MGNNINKIFSQIDHFIRAGEYTKAVDNISKLKIAAEKSLDTIKQTVEISNPDRKTESSIILILNYAGFLIDCGSSLNELKLVDEGLRCANLVFKKLKSSYRLYSSFGYNIANGYASSFQIKQYATNRYYFIGEERLELTKKLYRTLLKSISQNDHLILQILTNFGNLLNGRLGRSLEALNFYNLALEINPKFSMALANKGYVQSLFASVIEGDAKVILLHEAYLNLKNAIKIGLDFGPKNYFSKILADLIKYFPNVVNLTEEVECKNIILKKNTFRRYYKYFCNIHDLYLNPIENSHKCSAALYDPLIINRMIVNNDEHNKFIKITSYFNQIKQEFAFARYLAAQSFFQDPRLKFIDKEIVILDTLDYSAHTIFLEHARSSYRIAYSLLDKIALLFNEYLDIGLNEKSIYFYKLAPLYSDRVLNKLSPITNPYISALLDLANDFRNGHFEKESSIRNSFEHRFKSIHIFSSSVKHKESEESLITTDEFRNILINLLKIVKSAIFYIVLLIEWEEKIKESSFDGLILPIPLHELPNNLKIE